MFCNVSAFEEGKLGEVLYKIHTIGDKLFFSLFVVDETSDRNEDRNSESNQEEE